MSRVTELLQPGGVLEQAIGGFRFRPQQLQMAQAVSDTLEEGGVLVCEAGTGTGKTFAYLIPALLSGRKVVISTGTKNLQDQLYKRDLPGIRELAGRPLKTALLKGRANYLCLQRMDSASFDRRAASPAMVSMLEEVRKWAGRTRHGDIAELSDIPEGAAVWPLVTSTVDNCLGQECPDYDGCFLLEARRNAQEADLVVINHYLLCADFALKQEGFGELLPLADAFIIDEAHQLPEIANHFFGVSVSDRQLHELTRDIRIAYRQIKMKQSGLIDCADAVDKSSRDFRLLFGMDERRGAWRELQQDERLLPALDETRARLDELIEALTKVEGGDKALDSCLSRAGELSGVLKRIVSQEDGDESIRWFEITRLGYRLSQTPLQIADAFQEQMREHAPAWIFTSATLAVGDDFSHFMRQLGLDDASRTERWESPFDFQHQAMWYVPKGLVEPRERGFVKCVVEAALPVIRASGGRTFLLFTSHRALNEAAELLEEELDYPLLIQGSMAKNELLEQFREAGDAVLLGTGSFWEGVDVQGAALSVVIIDKLPFAAPGDPLLQARLDALRKQGRNPFMEHQVPQAVIALKQGAGRLIRGVDDTGVLMTCDMRLLTKPYGKVFIDAMPPFSRSRELSEVTGFIESIHESAGD
ncbi:MAG: ATP-dependent DNA helicase [Pseudomonadota bacterium]